MKRSHEIEELEKKLKKLKKEECDDVKKSDKLKKEEYSDIENAIYDVYNSLQDISGELCNIGGYIDGLSFDNSVSHKDVCNKINLKLELLGKKDDYINTGYILNEIRSKIKWIKTDDKIKWIEIDDKFDSIIPFLPLNISTFENIKDTINKLSYYSKLNMKSIKKLVFKDEISYLLYQQECMINVEKKLEQEIKKINKIEIALNKYILLEGFFKNFPKLSDILNIIVDSNRTNFCYRDGFDNIIHKKFKSEECLMQLYDVCIKYERYKEYKMFEEYNRCSKPEKWKKYGKSKEHETWKKYIKTEKCKKYVASKEYKRMQFYGGELDFKYYNDNAVQLDKIIEMCCDGIICENTKKDFYDCKSINISRKYEIEPIEMYWDDMTYLKINRKIGVWEKKNGIESPIKRTDIEKCNIKIYYNEYNKLHNKNRNYERDKENNVYGKCENKIDSENEFESNKLVNELIEKEENDVEFENYVKKIKDKKSLSNFNDFGKKN